MFGSTTEGSGYWESTHVHYIDCLRMKRLSFRFYSGIEDHAYVCVLFQL